MSKNSDDWQCYDGSFNKDNKEIFQRNRDLAAHDDTADFGHIDQLCYAGCCNHKSCDLAFDGGCDDAGQEHIRKADDDRLAGQLCFGNLQ